MNLNKEVTMKKYLNHPNNNKSQVDKQKIAIN